MTESLFFSHLKALLEYSSADADSAARTLLQRYGNISSLAACDFDELVATVGDKSAYLIRIAFALAQRKVTDAFKLGVRHTDEEIIEYFAAKFYTRSVESSFVMLFDGEDRVIGCEFLGEGTVNFFAIPPRKVLEVAIKKNAVSAVIAHNHPAGVAKPSCEDIEATRLIAELFRASGRSLKAHYVFAGKSHEVILPTFAE